MTTFEAVTARSVKKRSFPGRKWASEPLTHFLVLGLALFLVWSWLGDKTEPSRRHIVISAGQMSRAIEAFRRTHLRSPDADELKTVADAEIEDEIYFREGMALGLDQDDEIIRRRIRQKLLFMTQDVADLVKPSDTELNTFLKAHAADYGGETQFVFSQIYLDPSRHKDPAADAKATLARLNAGDGRLDYATLSDTLPFPADFEATPIHSVSNMFGQEFGEALKTQPMGHWVGPIASGFGFHLVLIRDRIDPRPPSLASVRDAVSRDWQAEKRRETNSQLYRTLRANYKVTVEMPKGIPNTNSMPSTEPGSNE